MKTKIILERHGQSVGNAEGIYLGHTDLGLTEEGIVQANITARHLKDVPISAVYSSDLKRAYATALPHAKIRALTVNTREDLRELFVGDWEGMSVPELRLVDDFNIRRTHRDFVYPNGESTAYGAERMKLALLDIGRQNEGKTVLVVSHSAVIRAFWYYLCGYTEQNMTDRVPFIANASYCILSYENGVLTPCEYGISEHLPATKIHPV